MTEQEYLNVRDLARVRWAVQCVSDLQINNVIDQAKVRDMLRTLRGFEEQLYESVKIEK